MKLLRSLSLRLNSNKKYVYYECRREICGIKFIQEGLRENPILIVSDE